MIGSEDHPRYHRRELLAWCAAILAAAGMPTVEAETAASVLVRTSLRGVDTHGLSRVPLYVEVLLDGSINPAPDHGAALRDGMLHYRGDHGLGQVIGVAAMRAAMELARERAVVPCLIHECRHLAALGTYVLIAAEADMIGILCQCTTPWMALPGWTQRAIGNNPLAFATPLDGRAPLVFDMSASVVARGNLRQAMREKTGIPEGWAIAPDGRPTTDAETAMAGAVLPVGGYKGMGIAMLVQTLAGSLLGANPSAMTGAFLMVVNPRLVTDGYSANVNSWLSQYMQAGGADARYPGQRAAESEAGRLKKGIPVPPVLLQQLKDAGTRLSRPFALQPVTGGAPEPI